MDSQKTTSKTSLLNLMLLRAWRERWTDSQWGINIKTVLPRGVSGDVYNLADCILQQAVVGSDANKLVLSYLRHSLCSHLISHAAVLKRISKYDCFDKSFCLIALLDFLESIISGTTCRSKVEENVLANALLSLVHWLTQIYASILDANCLKGSIDQQQQKILNMLSNVMDKIVSNQFLMGVIYVGRHEDPELIIKIQKKYTDIKKATLSSSFVNSYHSKCFEDLLKSVALVDINGLVQQDADITPESITYCLQPLIAVEVLLNPNNSTQSYVSLLLMIQRLKNYSMSRLYCELIRSCLASLYNVSGVSGANRESMWCAFTFIKVPQILKELNNFSKASSDEKLDFSPDIIAAFELLLDDPVLDFLDTKCGCNTVESLLVELEKHNLVTDVHVKLFSSRRESVTTALSKIELNKNYISIIKLIKRAEHPLPGILKALESEYNKMYEALLGMLVQVLSGSGNSFDLILSVVTVEGKLKTFVSRLIRYNEGSKQIVGESEQAAKVRATLFDVTFLMLTFIVQTYGSEVVLDEHGDTFFEKWVRECMIERNKHKSPMNMVHQCDQNKVDELLVYLNSTDRSLTPSSLKWQDICTNIPGVLYHLLLAWENETITAAEVKTHLDSIKSRLCMYSVCAASWLCSYMQVVRDDELLKPMNMVQQFLTPLGPEELAQQDNNMKDRLGLTIQIIRQMQHDIHQNQKMRAVMITQNIVSQQPLDEQFFEVWKTINERGWLPVESTQVLDSLLQSCGPFWLVSKLVNEVLQCKYSKDMNKTVDIVFAIMHINIEACTVSLLAEFLPILLLNKMQKFELVEPQSTTLARLCVYCIISSLEVCLNSTNKKRPLSSSSDSTDIAGRIAKIRKLNTDESSNSSLTDYPMQEDFSSTGPGIFCEQSSPVIREPLQSCLQNLFKMFAQFTVADNLSPRIYFIFQFLTLLQQCGKDRVKPAMKLLPNGLIQNLLKVMITNDFTYDFILKIYDLSTTSGRHSAMSDLCLLRTIQLRKTSINI